MNSKLKPCPRCGNKGKRNLSFVKGDFDDSENWLYAGYCKVCCISGPFEKTKQKAIAAWNERVTEEKK